MEYIIVSLISLLAIQYILFFIFIWNSIKDSHHINPEDFLGLLSILSSQIKSELDTYEQDIFSKKGTITNNNFDNYYKDLTSRIITNISPVLIKDLSYYYTEDAVYKFIGRSVRDYLVTKIKGTF